MMSVKKTIFAYPGISSRAGKPENQAFTERTVLFTLLVCLFRIIVESFSGLAAEFACAYHFPEKRSGTVFRIACL